MSDRVETPADRPQSVGGSSAAIAGVARVLDVAYQLCAAYVPQRARRFRAPDWVRHWLLAPAIAVAYPLILLIIGDVRRRVRVLTGEFRDLCNPIRNLACVLAETRGVAAARPVVVHKSRIVLGRSACSGSLVCSALPSLSRRDRRGARQCRRRGPRRCVRDRAEQPLGAVSPRCPTLAPGRWDYRGLAADCRYCRCWPPKIE